MVFLLWLRRVGGPWGGRWWLLLAMTGCRPGPPPPAAPAGRALRPHFFALLHAGDSLYAQKASYDSFARALAYYDSAQALAARSQDTLLLAEAVFARARVYDAWNKEPQKTIRYFQQATDLFRRLPGQRRRYYYAWHLVAHAYDKVPDSLHTVQVLRALRRELHRLPPDSLRRLPFTVELALIATQVRHYALADTLLRQLTRRAWVANDPATYDYLSHYYLIQARLAVLHRHQPATPYLDSLARAEAQARNPLDRTYYSDNLARLYAAAGQYAPAYRYLRRNVEQFDSLQHSGDTPALRQALVASEQRATRQQQAYETARRASRQRAIGGLSLGLVVISLLSFYLARQARVLRAKSARLLLLNDALDAQVAQVQLLNKEMQHRVKNNLHMVFSLLQMQERRSTHPEVVANLQAARLRVESIAALHNQLLGNPDGLDLADFLKALIASVVGCLANDRQVVSHLQTDTLPLPPESYLPLSLILNEWVTNSIKYAAPAAPLLELRVRVHERAGEACLEYHDNGVPPATGAAAAAEGLGTRIIALLSRQLGATLSTPPGQPYHYTLCIPLPPHGPHRR